jgi:glycosyltransferase involved in cell wall biosynthesis
MRSFVFAVPGDIETLTGGYAYAREMVKHLPQKGWEPVMLRLGDDFPLAGRASLLAAKEAFLGGDPAWPVLVDGLAFGALPEEILALKRRWVALVHHPLALETGLDAATAARLAGNERRALGHALAVVATSGHTGAGLVADYGVGKERLFVAPPGTAPAMRAKGGGEVPVMLTVASFTPRKAHDVLVEALALLTDLSWRAVFVGDDRRDPATVRMLRGMIAAKGLAGRIAFAGPLQDGALDAAYAGADLFVLPSRHEGYGMVFAEALARGLPIVACAAGATVDTVPGDAGRLVPPDDAEALAGALREMIGDKALRRDMADMAWKHGQSLPRWGGTAAIVARALEAAL